MEGLAPDGGLFIPDSIPDWSSEEKQASLLKALKEGGYRGIAFEVFRAFVSAEDCPDEDLKKVIAKAYSTEGPNAFKSSDVVALEPVSTPLSSTPVPLDFPAGAAEIGAGSVPEGMEFLELFHGPTFAFKDVALQLLGQFFDYFYDASVDPRPLTVLGATSGDTGGAAMAGMAACANVRCIILYPLGGTSDVQEAQMIHTAKNSASGAVHAVAVADASFDDCQNAVKEMFLTVKEKYRLVAVNSINWCRIMAQIVYYWFTALSFKRDARPNPVITVPTGNFGNILAAYYARKMGAPIERLVIASNSNDILYRVHTNGEYKLEKVIKTHSPSMDIGISSNFERLIFELEGSNVEKTAALFNEFKTNQTFSLSPSAVDTLHKDFSAYMANDTETESAMRLFRDEFDYSVCPHTAVGAVCALKYINATGSKSPMVVAATADAAKFPAAWESAKINASLVMPQRLQEAIDAQQPLDSCRRIIAKGTDAVMTILDEF